MEIIEMTDLYEWLAGIIAIGRKDVLDLLTMIGELYKVPQGHANHVLWLLSSLEWRHNGHDGVSGHQPHDCLLNRLFRRRSKKTSKLRITGLCVGNSPATGEFPAHMASSAENVFIWWHHHDESRYYWPCPP